MSGPSKRLLTKPSIPTALSSIVPTCDFVLSTSDVTGAPAGCKPECPNPMPVYARVGPASHQTLGPHRLYNHESQSKLDEDWRAWSPQCHGNAPASQSASTGG